MKSISNITGRGGRARTCDNRFWRPSLKAENQRLSATISVKPSCGDQRVRSVLSNRDGPPDPQMQRAALAGDPNCKSSIISNSENNAAAENVQGETALAAAMRAALRRAAR